MSKERSSGVRDTIANASGGWTKSLAASLRGRRTVLALAAVATLASGGTASAITSSAFTYSATQTGHFSISPLHLAPSSSVVATTSGYSIGLSLTVNNGGCFNTGVNLPQGAILRRVLVHYRASAQSGSAAALIRNQLSGDGIAQLADLEFKDASGSLTSAAVAVPPALGTVKNDIYSYGFVVCLAPGDAFEGARITYTLPRGWKLSRGGT